MGLSEIDITDDNVSTPLDGKWVNEECVFKKFCKKYKKKGRHCKKCPKL
jgi:ligand-binding sensor protein